MWGIVAYLGYRKSYTILLDGRKRPDYRDWNSSGRFLLEEDLVKFKKRGQISEAAFKTLILVFEVIPHQVNQVLEQAKIVKSIASEIKSASNALYLLRGYTCPINLEGAWKLEENLYIRTKR